MSILDSIKKLARGHKKEVSDGLEQAAGLIEGQVGHKDIVEQGVNEVEKALGVDQPKKQHDAKK